MGSTPLLVKSMLTLRCLRHVCHHLHFDAKDSKVFCHYTVIRQQWAERISTGEMYMYFCCSVNMSTQIHTSWWVALCWWPPHLVKISMNIPEWRTYALILSVCIYLMFSPNVWYCYMIVTFQLALFGFDRGAHVDFLEKSNIAFKHLFLQNWEPSYETMPYPPATGAFAVYTIPNFYESVNFAQKQVRKLCDMLL